jgi:hypothetical protein
MGTMTLYDRAVSQNRNDSAGGGIFNNDTLEIRNSTVTGNISRLGGGIYNYQGT